MLKRILGLFSLAFVMTAAVCLAAPAARAATVMKIAHGDPEVSAYNNTLKKFKELVDAASVGLDVQIFPGGQLGAEQTAFQDTQNNILQGAVLNCNNVSPFATSYSVLDLPYVFTSVEQFVKALNENESEFIKTMIEEADARPVAWGSQGFRLLSNSKKPINTIDDLKGLKIRLPNNALQLATFRAFGCDGVPMAIGELFGALQQGVVDGLELPYFALAAQKMYEVQKYVTDIRYKLDIYLIVVSESWFQKQPKEVQDAIMKAGREATAHTVAGIPAQEAASRQVLIDNGMIIGERPKDEAVWIEKAKTVWPGVYKLIKNQKLFDGVLASVGQTKP